MASTSPDSPRPTRTGLGVDVGGTGIKVGLVNLDDGELIGDRELRPTPQPATPDAIAATIRQTVDEFGWDGPVGVALPSVIHEGVARIAHNIDKSWIGCDVVDLFDRHLPGRTVVMLNDADAAGLTEVHYGAGGGVDGLVILLTLGTGIGSALLMNGRLVPNTEFGHLIVEDIAGRGFDEAEHHTSPTSCGPSRTSCGLGRSCWEAVSARPPTSGSRCSRTAPRYDLRCVSTTPGSSARPSTPRRTPV